MPRTPVRYKHKRTSDEKFFWAVLGTGCLYALASAMVSVGFIAVLIWAIVKLVNHFV